MPCRDQSALAPWPIFPQHAEDSAPSLANSTKQVNAEGEHEDYSPGHDRLSVLTGVAGSAPMIRSGDASGEPRDAA
jgi:hypothetical protein